jgi:hypothetical protein
MYWQTVFYSSVDLLRLVQRRTDIPEHPAVVADPHQTASRHLRHQNSMCVPRAVRDIKAASHRGHFDRMKGDCLEGSRAVHSGSWPSSVVGQPRTVATRRGEISAGLDREVAAHVRHFEEGCKGTPTAPVTRPQ